MRSYAAMMTYDIILTFPLEVEKIWTKKFTGVTVLWFLVRSPMYSIDLSLTLPRTAGGFSWRLYQQ